MINDAQALLPCCTRHLLSTNLLGFHLYICTAQKYYEPLVVTDKVYCTNTRSGKLLFWRIQCLPKRPLSKSHNLISILIFSLFHFTFFFVGWVCTYFPSGVHVLLYSHKYFVPNSSKLSEQTVTQYYRRFLHIHIYWEAVAKWDAAATQMITWHQNRNANLSKPLPQRPHFIIRIKIAIKEIKKYSSVYTKFSFRTLSNLWITMFSSE